MAFNTAVAAKGKELTILFVLLDPTGTTPISGQAGNVGIFLRDQDGASSDVVTVQEQSSGWYEARITPSKGHVDGFSYLLTLVSPTPATDGARLEYHITVFPSLAGTVTSGSGLTTLAAVKEYLGIAGTTNDALLTNLIIRVSRLLETLWGQRIGLTSYDEKRHGMGTPDLLVRRPIASITSLHQSLDQTWDSSTLIAASDYLFDAETGIIHLKAGGYFWRGFRNVRIVYDAGVDPIPADIEEMAIRAVAREFTAKDALGVVSMSLKDGSFTKKTAEKLFEPDMAILSAYVDYAAIL